ncbi:uncharacterized protein LOC119766984 isoform X2 [Culex quinquefasciatus]|nr:uncharacterized protein LOC119766984 isoform X2 [Culex quinquefasciatus]
MGGGGGGGGPISPSSYRSDDLCRFANANAPSAATAAAGCSGVDDGRQQHGGLVDKPGQATSCAPFQPGRVPVSVVHQARIFCARFRRVRRLNTRINSSSRSRNYRVGVALTGVREDFSSGEEGRARCSR